MTKKELTEATQRYLNNGWLINNTPSNKDNLSIEFAKWSNGAMVAKLELSEKNGVRIKGTNSNWNYTDWNGYNGLTAWL